MIVKEAYYKDPLPHSLVIRSMSLVSISFTSITSIMICALIVTAGSAKGKAFKITGYDAVTPAEVGSNGCIHSSGHLAGSRWSGVVTAPGQLPV